MRAPASICLFHGTEPGGQGEFLYFICLCHVSLCLLVSPGPRLGLPIVLAFSIFHLAFPSAPSLPASLPAPPSVRRACALVDPGRSFRMVGPWSCRDGGLLPLACPPAAPLPAKWPQGISLPGPRLTCRGRSPSVTFLLYLSGRGCGNREEAAGDPWHSLNQHSEPEQIPRLCKTARIGSQEGSQAGAASKILRTGRRTVRKRDRGSCTTIISPNGSAVAAQLKKQICSLGRGRYWPEKRPKKTPNTHFKIAEAAMGWGRRTRPQSWSHC